MKRFALSLAAICCSVVGLGHAEDVPDKREAVQPIVVRQTIPYPDADGRQPLTSDQLDTSTTRLIDARRGFRPYRSYPPFIDDRYAPSRVYYRDTFGIIRPPVYDLPYRSPNPATGPVSFSGASNDQVPKLIARPLSAMKTQPPLNMVVFDERESAVEPGELESARQREGVDMVIRIHQGEAKREVESGTAVLIRADGTVIEVR